MHFFDKFLRKLFTPARRSPKTSKMDLRQLITDQTNVSLTLARHVASTEANNTNLVFSPLSLHVVLSLIAAGSAGSTRKELLSFLKSKSPDDLNKLSSELATLVFADGSPAGGPKLSFANGVWVDQSLPLKLTFKRVVDDLYKAVSNQVDFLNKADQVASEVNTWAENQTNGLIKELLPPGSVDHTTKLILGNALYFKGAWNEKFDASKTRQYHFHLLNGGSVEVPFMTSKEDQFICRSDNFKVLRLPYQQGADMHRQFSMYIFLPNEKDGLPSLLEEMGSHPGFIDENIPHMRVDVRDFKLPRFKIAFGFEASKVLKGLGVKQPFLAGGLTEMVDSSMGSQLHVSSIFQKSFIEVNEVGTEAAAATAATIRLLCYTPPVDFVADHPFVFVIREDTSGAVLFIGHVVNPSL